MSDEHKDKAHDEGHGGGGHGGHGGGHHGGGGGHAEGEHEGAPEWLISFADNVALLMGFFVILLAMNMKAPNTGGIGGEKGDGAPSSPDMIDAAIAIRQAFNSPVDMGSSDPADQPLIRRLRERAGGEEVREPGPKGNDDRAQSVRPSDYTTLGGRVEFETTSATLSAHAREVAADIGRLVRGRRWVVEVRGHASPSETGGKDVDKAYRLSYERALVVARALVEHGAAWNQIRLVACGDQDRVTGRAFDREGQRPNQRVEVVMTKDPIPDDPLAIEPSDR
ncbi:MAG: OmpA family protein [Phycisphaerae bacterium]|nr:OmpA family protein [Phycisphaerae bacterium]